MPNAFHANHAILESDFDRRLKRIERLASLMDSQWQIPGTQMRIGIDGVLGFLPGFGDTIGTAISSWIIYEAHCLKAPLNIKLRMVWNVAVDTLIGAIPLIGDFFDIAWKANQKNARLLHEHVKNYKNSF